MDTDGFQVRIIDNEKGKGLFATRAYKKGSIIFEEKPIVCCQFPWNAEYGYLACDNCLKPLENAEETAQCSACGTKYCSNECQNEAMERYHKILCLQTRDKNEDHPLVQLNEIWKQMHYPPETATIMLLARMIAIVIQTSNQEDILQTFSQFCHRTVNDTDEIAHNLLGEKFIGQIDLLRQMLQKALNNDYTSNWFTPEGFRSLLALVGTNGQGIGTNAFAQWVGNVNVLKLPKDEKIHINKFINRLYDDMKEVVGSFLNNEGSGLYVLQSKINHSCLSNADVEFPYSNNVLVLKATRDIQPGEEICISYLEDCELRSRHSRQKALKSYYLFICSCEKCQSEAGDPDETSDDNEYM
ncbi:SET and MYND domain-containing protein 5-like isoform X2 [Vespa mandarinia]|uniref:SET and MYND domain-containing protein 5-like isoform X2 n=1 Tax=Vespa mandarinia TaxID=7446 RepID=UPI00161D21BD|nr:SET and MYND domain-containing protein 5-like isoform X2 [Vespa mandarinia]